MADVARDNLRTLKIAKDQGRLVRFVYNTKTDGKVVPRVGTVREVNPAHVVINDTFHNGQPRSSILGRIVGKVEIQ